ncbi:MAG: ATP-binding protein [Acidobacteria bacterium]|nr:ATP-binding protein [Acidobacteriota bacterium]
MVNLVSKIGLHPFIGKQLFDVITSGMYDNPLMIYREYIQNSVDSIDQAISDGVILKDDAQISITLNGKDRNIIIEDNGYGISNEIAHEVLINVGCSPKEGTDQRGFRGIGRLGGLAYCDELVFETRSPGDEHISVIRWNRKEFESRTNSAQSHITMAEIITSFVSVEHQGISLNSPPNFFRVTLRNVHSFHSDLLMNFKVVYDYLAQCAPVPYNKQVFHHAEAIENSLSGIKDFKSYRIILNNHQIFRPYKDEIKISEHCSDQIHSIEFIQFKGVDSEIIALGWYARTSFLASLPTVLNIKGIRVRQGNIEVGGEHFLDDKFSEARFSGWQIGEIHIVDRSLIPNARRDSFEHTPLFERFLEQLNFLGRHLSSTCRKSSNARIANLRIQNCLSHINEIHDNSFTYIDTEHYEQAFKRALGTLQQVEKAYARYCSDEMKQRLITHKQTVEKYSNSPLLLDHVLDMRKLRRLDQKALLKRVAKAIVADYRSYCKPEEILKRVFSDFIKPKYKNHSHTSENS